MHNPKHVVLATDLTQAADPAMTVAGRFAKALKVDLTIFHVFQYVPRHEYLVPVDWMIHELRRKVELKLDSMRQTLADIQVEAHASVVEDGNPSQQVLNFLSGVDSPLIVMGTHASAGIERFILGSTAEAVLRQATCPAVTVGPAKQWVESPRTDTIPVVFQVAHRATCPKRRGHGQIRSLRMRRATRPQLAGLVRRVYGARAGRPRTAATMA